MGAFFIAAVFSIGAQAFCPAPSGAVAVRVEHVVDGDTVRLSDGRRVRLIGLNAPEMSRSGASAEAFAVQAQRRLQRLVAASGYSVALVYGEQAKDRYGRVLGHLYDSAGRNLEAQLLSEGLAYSVAIAPNTALVACHQTAERAARQARLGLWKKPQIYHAGELKRSGFALLQGRVERVVRNRGGLWIELDGDRVLRVAPQQVKAFESYWRQDLQGREVLARGWVIDRGAQGSGQKAVARWLLPLGDAAMLELL